MKIIESTDRKYIGQDIVLENNTVILPDGFVIPINIIINDPDGTVILANSNYQIRVTNQH